MREMLDWVIEEGRILIGRAGRERDVPLGMLKEAQCQEGPDG